MPQDNFADLVKQVLIDTETAENRAAKMDIDDLLKLLAAAFTKRASTFPSPLPP